MTSVAGDRMGRPPLGATTQRGSAWISLHQPGSTGGQRGSTGGSTGIPTRCSTTTPARTSAGNGLATGWARALGKGSGQGLWVRAGIGPGNGPRNGPSNMQVSGLGARQTRTGAARMKSRRAPRAIGSGGHGPGAPPGSTQLDPVRAELDRQYRRSTPITTPWIRQSRTMIGSKSGLAG